MACCKFFSRFSKTSQQFLGGFGALLTCIMTRWKSYINTDYAVYSARAAINEYVNSADFDANAERKIRHRVDFLIRVGYQTLHDMIVLLKPLTDINIDDEQSSRLHQVLSGHVCTRLKKEWIC